MSEVMKCDRCGKVEDPEKAGDWWRVEPVRSFDFIANRGGDFCSDKCAYDFFRAKKSIVPQDDSDSQV